MQALYNEIRDMVGKINIQDLNKPTNQIQPFQQSQTNYSVSTQQITHKSFLQYQAEKRELENKEDYGKWLAAVEADPLLSTREKNLLKTIL